MCMIKGMMNLFAVEFYYIQQLSIQAFTLWAGGSSFFLKQQLTIEVKI